MADTQVDKVLRRPDYNSPRESGDFYLLECSVHSPSGGAIPVQLNVPGVLIELNVYEDLFSNVLRGQLSFMDTQGIAEAIPLIGDETLILSFLTPGGEGTQITTESSDRDSQTAAEESITQRFKIYDCQEIAIQNRVKNYRLFFVSEEYVYNSKTKVSKGYNGKLYGAPIGTVGGSIVEDVMNKINKNIKSNYRKNIYIEKTGTPQNVIIPNWSPFQAINFCASRSLSNDATPQDQTNATANPTPRALGSLFVFYEKLGTGFFYESIETIIGKQKSQDNIPLYQYTPKISGNRKESLGMNYFGVDKFEVVSSFKTLENLQQGMFGSTLIAYDPLRMKFDKIKYDYHRSTVKEKEEFDEETGVTQVSTEADNQADDTDRRFHDFVSTDIGAQDKKQNKLISTKSDLVGSNDAVIKLATTTRDHEYFAASGPESFGTGATAIEIFPKTSIGVTLTTFKDQGARSNKVEDWLLQRQAQKQEFENIVVTFSVPGNSSRHVGDLVRFEIPTTLPDDDPNMMGIPLGHQLYSGYYIVSKVRHIITTDRYQTDVELIKNSFAKRIPGQLTDESTE
jgi:hypothetical protein